MKKLYVAFTILLAICGYTTISLAQTPSTTSQMTLSKPPEAKDELPKYNAFWAHEAFNDLDEVDKVYGADNHIGGSYQLDQKRRVRLAYRFANNLPVGKDQEVGDQVKVSDPYAEYKHSGVFKDVFAGYGMSMRHRVYLPVSESSRDRELLAKYIGRFDFSKSYGSKFDFINRVQTSLYFHNTPRATISSEEGTEVSANSIWKLEYLPIATYTLVDDLYLNVAGYLGQQDYQKVGGAKRASEVTAGGFVSVAYIPVRQVYLELAYERYHRVDENRNSTSYLGLYTELSVF